MRIAILDTETTGTNPGIDQVIELAWVEVPSLPHLPVDFETAEQFEGRFHPDVPIQYGAMAVHHILPSDLTECPPSSELIEEWQDHGFDYIIGHNIDFDADMLGGMPGARRICTLALSRFLLPELDSHKQGAVLYHYAGLTGWQELARRRQREAHSAKADVRMCHAILVKLLLTAVIKGFSVGTWHDVYELSQLARIPTVMGFGKYRGVAIADIDRGYVRWYRSQVDTDPYYLEAFRRAGY